MKTNIMLLFLCLFCFSCKKTDNTAQLPPITHTGANIVAFKLNGKVYIVTKNQPSCLLCSYGITYSPPDNTGLIYINANNENPRFEINIQFHFADSIGTYLIKGNYPNISYFYDYSNGTLSTGSNSFSTDSLRGGVLNVLYFDGHIISGTFQFDEISSNDSIIHVTEGRFDLAN